MRTQRYGHLPVLIAEDDVELGEAAAAEFAEAVNEALSKKPEIAVIMSLGAAQPTFFPALIARQDIDWSRIAVFHVDTYLGVANDRFESGAARLRENLLDHVRPMRFFPMNGAHEPIEEEIKRYEGLIRGWDPDVCVVGIGWSGHLAFCDPPADFEDHRLVRAVALSPISREQILSVGYFKTLEAVPEYGMTLTIPALLRPRRVLALVHQQEKAAVIGRILNGPVSIMVPASVLRTQPHARLYLGPAAANMLGE
ncbi:MAG: 6-phosphogluconolactonase [Propionibacteriaceae bacterium]|nr:6-phosphogluconolactonase [Propionibacteriaceae bacterium]